MRKPMSSAATTVCISYHHLMMAKALQRKTLHQFYWSSFHSQTKRHGQISISNAKQICLGIATSKTQTGPKQRDFLCTCVHDVMCLCCPRVCSQGSTLPSAPLPSARCSKGEEKSWHQWSLQTGSCTIFHPEFGHGKN